MSVRGPIVILLNLTFAQPQNTNINQSAVFGPRRQNSCYYAEITFIIAIWYCDDGIYGL